jgi:hypothetical protein
MRRLPLFAALAILSLAGPLRSVTAAPIRAAYFYNYMPASHLDSLAVAGFDRAVVHWITDSLGATGTVQLRNFVTRGAVLGVSVAPQWALQARQRLEALPTSRRYTWGAGTVESAVACPLDSLFWRSALLDRANELLTAAPGLERIAIDLEIYGGGRHHYDAGPCRCTACLSDYSAGTRLLGRDPRRLSGLMAYEEGRLGRILTGLLSEFAVAHPGVEIGVFDLDFDSFVHRAFARALARAHVPTVDYCERTYATGGAAATIARSRLTALGLPEAPIVGGLWLKRWAPGDLRPAAQSIFDRAEGYFVFTTYSLWLDPAQLAGPYTLLGAPAAYWSALRQINEAP